MPGQIAQLGRPAGGVGSTYVIPDWQNGKIYVLDWATKYTYSTALVTQAAPLLTVTVSPNRQIFGADIDPVTGYLLIQQAKADGSSSINPVFKVDPATFADVASFGVTSTTWPAGISQGEALVCVGCGTQASGGAAQVGYCVIKEGVTSGTVGVIRTDTMQQAGFYHGVVSGVAGSNNRGLICRGASGAGGASAFLSWNAQSPPNPTVPLYAITITPGAELYNPASWPTTNSHITSRTVGTIPAASVDPTWSNLTTNSLGYDQTDGSVLMAVATTDAVTQKRYLLKLNPNTAAIIWKTPLPTTLNDPGLPGSSIGHSIAGLTGTPAYGLTATDTGVLTTSAPFNLDLASNFFVSSQQTSNIATDTAGIFFVSLFTYNSALSGAPTPVAGTPSTFSASFALIGGLIPPFVPSGGGGSGLRLAMDNVSVTAQMTLLQKNLVSLRWSDDRGHSFGSWVSQPIGEAGEYRTSLQWQRLAYARDRVFEISWSVPMRTALQGCWVDVTPAQS